MTLGEKIKYYREKQKMGQQDLAELSHISVSAIRKYESGLRVPKEAQLEKLAVALHISPSVLKDTSFKKFTDLLPYLYEIGVSGIDIIKGFKDYIRQEHPDEDFYDREAFENKTKDAIGYYDVPIEVQP